MLKGEFEAQTREALLDGLSNFLQASGVTMAEFVSVLNISPTTIVNVVFEKHQNELINHARQVSFANMKLNLQANFDLQESLFGEYLQTWEDASFKEDDDVNLNQWSHQHVTTAVREMVASLPMSDTAFAQFIGMTIEDYADSLADSMVKNGDLTQADANDNAFNTSMMTGFLNQLKTHLLASASAYTSDQLQELYHLDASSSGAVENYPEDNCRFASRIISAEEYVDRHFPAAKVR